MDIFSERLKDLRIENGYKQETLARQLNITKSAYGYYEQGRNEPPIEITKEIATFYNTSTDYLYGRTDKPDPPSQDAIIEKLDLNERKLEVINLLDEGILDEIAADPEKNTKRIEKMWNFIKKLDEK